jgi:hypothetical protein
MAFAGCTERDRTGVRVDEDGLPAIINCGTWIEGVVVTDAGTGQRVWAAHAQAMEGGGLDTVDQVTVGVLPVTSWAEDDAFTAQPRPTTWRFSVDIAGDDAVIKVADRELASGHVYTGSDRRLSSSDFCATFPRSVTVVGIAVLGASFVYAAVMEVRRRRRAHQHA